MPSIVRDPDPDVALAFLREALAGLGRQDRLVQVVAQCRILYRGRARSQLNRGERLLLFKPDGTFLVHSASRAKPVNWQPPGASFQVAREDGTVVVTAYRAKPEELVRVELEAVRLLLSVPLRDEAELALVGSEDDLQRLLAEHPELVEDGFVVRRRERDSRRGFYDLDGDDREGRRVVVEVKRATAGVKEAQQLWRYVEGLRSEEGRGVRGVLIAPRVAAKARRLLADQGLEWKELDWDALLPRVEAMRRSGQASLGRFG